MKTCYLIGYPVSHSMSALMHNTAFKELSLDFSYEIFSVKSEDLAWFVASRLHEPDVMGANVTMPHKVSIIRYLDETSPEVSRIGAVNTIVNEDGHLKGYNTDGIGAMRALKEVYGNLDGATVALIGAGGAARAIGYYLSKYVEKVIVLNRTPSTAVDLAKMLSAFPECKANIRALPLQRKNLVKVLGEAHLLINATPLGMKPNLSESPVDCDLLRPGLFVFDSIYNPIRTRLLKEAEEAGAETLSGLKMFVYQGIASFKLWTGLEAPEELMYHVIEKKLDDEKI